MLRGCFAHVPWNFSVLRVDFGVVATLCIAGHVTYISPMVDKVPYACALNQLNQERTLAHMLCGQKICNPKETRKTSAHAPSKQLLLE